MFTIDSAAAVFNTQEQVTLLMTLSELYTTVMDDEMLKGIFYVTHPQTANDPYHNVSYDGNEMCRYGGSAPFQELVPTTDATGFDEISVSVDLLQCAQREDDTNNRRTKWTFNANFAYCAVAEDASQLPTNDLLGYIALFSQQLNATVRDPGSLMFPAFHDDGTPWTREEDLWTAGAFLSSEFQNLLHSWGVHGCGAGRACVMDPMAPHLAPTTDDDSFLWRHDQRCYRAQIPVDVVIPFDTNPMTAMVEVEFEVGSFLDIFRLRYIVTFFGVDVLKVAGTR